MLLLKPTRKFLSMKKDHEMGVGMEVNEVLADEVLTIRQIKDKYQDLDHGQRMEELMNEVPEHLLDLCKRSAADLKTSQVFPVI